MGHNNSYRFPFASYPAVRIVLLLIAGIVISFQFSIPAKLWVTLFAIITALFFLTNHLSAKYLNTAYYHFSIVLYVLVIAIFGGLWYSLSTKSDQSISQKLLNAYTWETIAAEGSVYSIKQTNTGKYQLDIKTSAITFSDSLTSGTPLNIRAVLDPAKTPLPDSLALGYLLGFQATVYPLESKRNPHQFDYKDYLASQNIFTQVGIDSILRVQHSNQSLSWNNIRQATLNLIDSNFSSQTRPLAKALLMGYKNELDRDQKIAFSRVGLSHIMAVSGLHVGFLLAPFWFVIPYFWTFKYGRHMGLALLIGLLFFYAGLTGFSASVTRASITGGFIMYGRLFNKVRDSINLTAVAAVIILLLDPAELFEIGFQLSFGAVYIILLVMPAISKMLPASLRFRWYGKLLMIILVSVVVQIGLFPLLSYYFGEFSLIGPLANAVVIPGLTFVVPFALFLLPVSSFFPAGGALLNIPNEWFLLKLNQFVSFTSTLKFSWMQTHVNDPLIFIIWLAIILGIASSQILKYRWKMVCLFLALLGLQQASDIFQKLKPATLEVTIFDVGQGDAALIKTPQNKHFLIDTGVWSPDYNSAKYVIIPHLKAAGITKLDAIFLSHPHADHIGGIKELIDTVPIDTIYNSGYRYNSNLYLSYLKSAAHKNIPVFSLRSGDMVTLDPAMPIFVYGPEQWLSGTEPNEHSLILELVYGQTEFLFMGDAGTEQEDRLLKAYGNLIDTDFLKVGHHGSRTSSSVPFLSKATADLSIVSLAKSNRFKHPHAQAINRLRKTGTKLKFTSLQKAMIFESDGEKINQKHW